MCDGGWGVHAAGVVGACGLVPLTTEEAAEVGRLYQDPCFKVRADRAGVSGSRVGIAGRPHWALPALRLWLSHLWREAANALPHPHAMALGVHLVVVLCACEEMESPN